METVTNNKDGITLIQSNNIGPFTLVVVRDDKTGLQGIGQARCSERDKYGRHLGQVIAYGRAKKALALKKAHKELRNWYLG